MSAPIPILDLTVQYEMLREEIESAVVRVLRSGRYVLGPEVEAFEAELADYLRVAHVVSCASGTDALQLAIHALDIGPGDQVLVPSFTFAAPAEAVALAGAEPVFIDIDADSFLLDIQGCRDAMTPQVRAVIVVHLFGCPVHLDALRDAVGDDVAIIEDCAQSLGAETGGQKLGSIGEISCFSFFPSKNLGACGDGGALATQDATLAARLRALRNHGSTEMYHYDILGRNSRLDELQAAILRIKLAHVDHWNRERAKVAQQYNRALQEFVSCQLPELTPGHVWHQYTLTTPHRDPLMRQLRADGIDSRIYYPLPLHRQAAYARWSPKQPLANIDRVCAQCLSLPMFPELRPDQIEQIRDSFARAPI